VSVCSEAQKRSNRHRVRGVAGLTVVVSWLCCHGCVGWSPASWLLVATASALKALFNCWPHCSPERSATHLQSARACSKFVSGMISSWHGMGTCYAMHRRRCLRPAACAAAGLQYAAVTGTASADFTYQQGWESVDHQYSRQQQQGERSS
jgi:hypothetical protein